MDKNQLLTRAFSLFDEIEQRQSQLRDILQQLVSDEEPASHPQSTYVAESAPVVDLSPVNSVMNFTPEAVVAEVAGSDAVEDPVIDPVSAPVVEQPVISQTVVITESAPLIDSHNKTDLRKSLTINDRFRFRRELFAGDESAMNSLLSRLSTCPTIADACDTISSLGWDMDSEAVTEFVEFVRNNFNAHRI